MNSRLPIAKPAFSGCTARFLVRPGGLRAFVAATSVAGHRVAGLAVAGLAVAGLCTAALAFAGGSSSRQPAHRSNVVIVIADQWRQEAFGFAGNRDVRTPALDRFARESVWLRNAVASVPVCCPTRASLLTGRRALSHGVFMNDVPLDPNADSMAKMFARAGYDTAFIGKWHVDGHGRSAYIPPERRQGFAYWRALECTHDYNRSAYYAHGPEKRFWPGYDAVAQTADAAGYIREHARGERPFLLVVSWGPPHEPYQTAPPHYRAMYDPVKLALRPNVPDEHREQARRDLAGYYAHCTALDDCFGTVRKTLTDAGIERDTIVLFMADHGDMLWSHGRQKKQQPFEESCRVPMFIHYPARLKPRRLDAVFATEDILPTLLGLCRLEIATTVQGLDYSACLAGGKDPSDGAALVSCPAPFGQWSRAVGGKEYRAIRTERYTYAGDLSGPWLLFDNRRDPYQLENLVGKPGKAKLQADLDARLRRKLKAAGDEFLPAQEYIRLWGYKVDNTGTVPFDP